MMTKFTLAGSYRQVLPTLQASRRAYSKAYRWTTKRGRMGQWGTTAEADCGGLISWEVNGGRSMAQINLCNSVLGGDNKAKPHSM